MSNKQFNELEIQFQEECKVINLRYEYDGYIGSEQWAIISELTEKEILEKYRPIVSDYIPFIVLTPAFGEVRDEYRRNEKKHYMRSVRGHCYALDEDFENHHSEFAYSTFEEDVLQEEQIQALRKAILRLTPMQKRYLEKYFFDGKNLRQIAAEEGKSYATVYESYESALKKLKKFLKNTR